jgi:hypothetical protein
MTDTEPADTRLARILHGYAPAQIAHVMARLPDSGWSRWTPTTGSR